MPKITILKRDYQNLLEKAMRYEYLRQILQEDVFSSPPTRNSKEIIKEFNFTKRYNHDFLKSLEKGLKRSFFCK